jgi:hypothetical protein
MQQDSSDPTGVKDTHQRADGAPVGSKEVIRARERKANSAIALRRHGASWDEIAEVLGYPTGRMALVAVERALEKELQTEESKKFMRKMAGERLDRMLRAVYPKAIDEDHPEQFAAVDRARALIGDHRKLFGLDAPTEMVVHNPNQSEIEKWVSQVLEAQSPPVQEADIFDVESWEEGEEDQRALPS